MSNWVTDSERLIVLFEILIVLDVILIVLDVTLIVLVEILIGARPPGPVRLVLKHDDLRYWSTGRARGLRPLALRERAPALRAGALRSK